MEGAGSASGPASSASSDFATVRSLIAAALAPAGADARRLGDIELLPHQLKAVAFLRRAIRRFGGALLADAVGLGKTYSALGVARGYDRVLIIHPAALRAMWTGALDRTRVIATLRSYESLSREGSLESGPIASGSRGSEGEVRVCEHFGLVILDEAHHARTRTARRFPRIARLAWGADVLLLSATPLHNHPRELGALLSLFLGARAESFDGATLGEVVFRRLDSGRRLALPRIRPTRWHAPSAATPILEAILRMPPPIPLETQGAAPALLRLSLIRQWCSSDAALLASVRTRLAMTQAALEYAREGRRPTPEMARRLIVDESTLQLDLFSARIGGTPRLHDLVESLATYASHLRGLLGVVAAYPGDAGRFTLLAKLLGADQGRRAVVFTHSIATARAAFRALASTHRCACLTGRGARIAGGAVTRNAVLEAFRPGGSSPTRSGAGSGALRSNADRIDVLIATDVLSEGVDLHAASRLVHLDLPWTESRLQQRVGRLRRIGAPHEEIEVEAIVPPADSEQLYGIIRRLAEKAGLADRLVGRREVVTGLPALTASRASHARHIHVPSGAGVDLAGNKAPWPAAAVNGYDTERWERRLKDQSLTRSPAEATDGRRPATRSLADVADQLRTTTRSPAEVGGSLEATTCSPAEVADHLRATTARWLRETTVERSGVAGANVVASCCVGSASGFVAVLEDAIGLRLLACDAASGDEPTFDPAVASRLLFDVGDRHLDVEAGTVDAALARISEFLRASSIVGDVPATLSPPQLRVLQTLRRVRLPSVRADRAAALAGLERARESVLADTGCAGAEYALEEWLWSLPAGGPTPRDVERLEAVLRSRRRHREAPSEARVVALLLVQPPGESR